MTVGASQAIGQSPPGIVVGRLWGACGQQSRVVLGEIVNIVFAQLLRKTHHHWRGSLAFTEGTPLCYERGLRLALEERQRRVDRFCGRVARYALRGGEPFANCRVAARRGVAEQQES
jgi:hypothetical protein